MTLDVIKEASPVKSMIRLLMLYLLLGIFDSQFAFAGSCSGSGGDYTCSGAANPGLDVVQVMSGSGSVVSVTTVQGFGIDTTSHNARAFDIIGHGAVFTDNYFSNITGSSGLQINSVLSGPVNVLTTGDIRGNSGYGISARNSGSELVLNVNNVHGEFIGVSARNDGLGSLTILSAGLISSRDRNALFAFNTGEDLIISINDVEKLGASSSNVITAINRGSGDLSLTSVGHIRADVFSLIGRQPSGIGASNNSVGQNMNISVNDITVAGIGIYVTNNGLGVLTINVNGSINAGLYGATHAGIVANALLGNMVSINLMPSTRVSSGSGVAILNNQSDSSVVVNSDALVVGEVRLGGGSDELSFLGGNFSQTTLMDGGDDAGVADGFIDVLSFSGSSGSLSGASLMNWENIIIDDAVIAFSDSQLTAGTTTVRNRGVLSAFGGFVLTGDLNVNATMTTQDSIAGDVVIIDGDFSGGGVLNIDTVLGDSSSQSDLFILEGNTSGNITLNVNNIGGMGAETGTDDGDGILLIDQDPAGTIDAVFQLQGELRVGSFIYELVQSAGGDWYLQSRVNPGGVFSDGFE